MRYLNNVSMFWKPLTAGIHDGLRRVQSAPNAIVKSSVIRFAYSPDMSSCLAGGVSPFLKEEIVGTANSSLTPGSSILSVAGKKRLPTISWAAAGPIERSAAVRPGRAVHQILVDMGFSTDLET